MAEQIAFCIGYRLAEQAFRNGLADLLDFRGRRGRGGG
jgi:hypothetical protein